MTEDDNSNFNSVSQSDSKSDCMGYLYLYKDNPYNIKRLQQYFSAGYCRGITKCCNAAVIYIA